MDAAQWKSGKRLRRMDFVSTIQWTGCYVKKVRTRWTGAILKIPGWLCIGRMTTPTVVEGVLQFVRVNEEHKYIILESA